MSSNLDNRLVSIVDRPGKFNSDERRLPFRTGASCLEEETDVELVLVWDPAKSALGWACQEQSGVSTTNSTGS